MKISLSKNTLKTKYEQSKPFHLKGTGVISEARSANPTVIQH